VHVLSRIEFLLDACFLDGVYLTELPDVVKEFIVWVNDDVFHFWFCVGGW
jgi:hypothetical protein